MTQPLERPAAEYPRDRVMRAFQETGFLHDWFGPLCPTGHQDHYWWSNGEYQERIDLPLVTAMPDESGVPRCSHLPACQPRWILTCLGLTDQEISEVVVESVREPEQRPSKEAELTRLWEGINLFGSSDLGLADRFAHEWDYCMRWMLGNAEEPTGKGNYWMTYKKQGVWSSDQEQARHLLARTGDRLVIAAHRIIELDKSLTEEQRELLQEAMKAGRSLSGKRVTSVLPWAHKELTARPEDFDTSPLLLNTPTGVVNLSDGSVMSHRPELLMTKRTIANWNPSAPAHRWETFLNEMVPDREVQAFLQEAAGLALTGEVDRRSKLIVLYGDGSNGKSVFTNVLRRVLGDYGFEGSPTVLQPHKNVPTDLYDLWGQRFVAINELEDEATELADAKVKQLTSEEPIPARKMHRDFVYYRATAHVFLKTNHFPIVKGRDHGIWSRIEIVRFDNKPRQTVDKLADLLVSAEADGILAWAWAGLQRVNKQGEIFVPAVVSAVKDAERAEQRSSIEVFLEEECQLSPTGWISTSDLQVEILRWAKDHNQVSSLPSSERGFGVALKKALRSIGWFQENDDSKPVQLKSNGAKRGYSGVSIKPWRGGSQY